MVKDNKVTVGLVGCGRMGAKTPERVRQSVPKGWLPLSHAEAINSIEELELIAVCDTDPERLSWAAQTYNVVNSYQDYEALIIETKPDIVSIATRSAERCDIIKFAAENGVKGIHAEKPISRNISDCRRALEAVVHNKVKFSYGTYRRYMEIYRKAKEMVNAGEIGELLEICIEHGKTMLMWNHPHSVDLILYYSDCLDVDFLQAFCQVNDPAYNSSIVDDDPVVELSLIHI
jgi:predicted dehydrogenase